MARPEPQFFARKTISNSVFHVTGNGIGRYITNLIGVNEYSIKRTTYFENIIDQMKNSHM